MLGIIVDARTSEDDFGLRIFHKFQDKSSLERVVEASLMSEYAHRVVVSMHVDSRQHVVGTTYRTSVVNRNISALGRTASYAFDNHSWLERHYYAARDHQLDVVVRVHADNPFVPPWLINEVIYTYYQEPEVFLHTSAFPGEEDGYSYPEGLSIEVMPFWMLARAKIYVDDDTEFYSYVSNNFRTKKFNNIEGSPNYIHPSKFSLKLSSKEQIPQFDALIEELKYSDLGDLLKEMSDGEV